MEYKIKEGEKQLSIKGETHRRLDILRAKNQLKTFDAVINYLLDFEYNSKKITKV